MCTLRAFGLNVSYGFYVCLSFLNFWRVRVNMYGTKGSEQTR